MKLLYTFLVLVSILPIAGCSANEIEVATVKPAPSFTWVNANGQVSFTNTSKDAESFSWDFGNGKTSTEPNPTLRYSKAGTYSVKLTARGNGGENSKTDNVLIPAVQYAMADVVDDKKLVDYLSGVWGVYVKDEGNKFDNYTYRFSPETNILIYQDYYQPSVSIPSAMETARVEFKYSIVNSIIYVEDATGKQVRHARIELVSDDEMKVSRLFETGNSFTEQLPKLFTKTSDIEKPVDVVVKSGQILSVLTGNWDQGNYLSSKDVFFDFSAGKNFYYYNATDQGGAKRQKVEFKIDANNVMSYRNWNTDFDPAWKKFKVEITSDTSLKFYAIDANGLVSKSSDYTLTKRK
ncbi:hypothetical protein GCM10027592_21740 [Spirosoma flavus]